ncbi:MAG TPA: hypothetical protein VH351_10630 [Bryobacteraceae bacterium]|nr:hypothetical protein [Bryobacteraceae bacterium]
MHVPKELLLLGIATCVTESSTRHLISCVSTELGGLVPPLPKVLQHVVEHVLHFILGGQELKRVTTPFVGEVGGCEKPAAVHHNFGSADSETFLILKNVPSI